MVQVPPAVPQEAQGETRQQRNLKVSSLHILLIISVYVFAVFAIFRISPFLSPDS